MNLLDYFIWGLIGGSIVEGLDIWRQINRNNGKLPPLFQRRAFYAAEAIRIICGAGLAVVLGASQQISGPAGAAIVGISAPIIVEKILAQQANGEDSNEG